MVDMDRLRALAAAAHAERAAKAYSVAGDGAAAAVEAEADATVARILANARRAKLEAMRARAFETLAPLGAVPSQRLAGRFRSDPKGQAYFHGRVMADGLVRFTRLADVTLDQAARILAIINEGTAAHADD